MSLRLMSASGRKGAFTWHEISIWITLKLGKCVTCERCNFRHGYGVYCDFETYTLCFKIIRIWITLFEHSWNRGMSLKDWKHNDYVFQYFIDVPLMFRGVDTHISYLGFLLLRHPADISTTLNHLQITCAVLFQIMWRFAIIPLFFNTNTFKQSACQTIWWQRSTFPIAKVFEKKCALNETCCISDAALNTTLSQTVSLVAFIISF